MATARRFLSTTPPSVADPPSEVTAKYDSAETMTVGMAVGMAVVLFALIIVLEGCIFAVVFGLLTRGGAGDGENGRPRGQPAANRGQQKKKVLRSLPKFVYGPAFVSENGGEQFAAVDCAICLAEYVEGEEVRMIPQCGHVFHLHCIELWLGSHSSCPLCRQIITVARCRQCGGDDTAAAAAGVRNFLV